MTQKNNRLAVKDQLNEAAEQGVQFVTYGDGDLGVPVAIDDAIRDFEAMEDQQIGNVEYGVDGLFECDSKGRIVTRVSCLYGGLTGNESGVIVWDGSDEVYCGNWVQCQAGLPRSLFMLENIGLGEELVCVRVPVSELDEDIRETAIEAAKNEGDENPDIREVYRVNDEATVILFAGWA